MNKMKKDKTWLRQYNTPINTVEEKVTFTFPLRRKELNTYTTTDYIKQWPILKNEKYVSIYL